MNMERTVTCYLLLSSVAAGVLLATSVLGSSNDKVLASSDRVIVGLVFIASCVFGIISSTKIFRPRKGAVHERKKENAGASPQRRRIGHHPDCDRFKGHVISVHGRTVCGGCLGLGIGSFVALLGMIAYLLGPALPPAYGLLLVTCGLALVAIDLIETVTRSRSGAIHVLANVLLVVGFLLIVIGVPAATGDGATGLMAVVAAFLFMDTRVQLSDWKHAKICNTCAQGCRSF